MRTPSSLQKPSWTPTRIYEISAAQDIQDEINSTVAKCTDNYYDLCSKRCLWKLKSPVC